MLNYRGPEDGEGIRVYYDGVQTGSDRTPSTGNPNTGDGRVVLGRYYTNRDYYYANVELEELLFFNESLSEGQIMQLKNLVSK